MNLAELMKTPGGGSGVLVSSFTVLLIRDSAGKGPKSTRAVANPDETLNALQISGREGAVNSNNLAFPSCKQGRKLCCYCVRGNERSTESLSLKSPHSKMSHACIQAHADSLTHSSLTLLQLNKSVTGQKRQAAQ